MHQNVRLQGRFGMFRLRVGWCRTAWGIALVAATLAAFLPNGVAGVRDQTPYRKTQSQAAVKPPSTLM